VSNTIEEDGGLPENDGAAGDGAVGDMCANATPLIGGAESLGILNASRLDLDGDGIEDVILHATSAVGASFNYVRYGRCPKQTMWDYHALWTPMSPEAGAGDVAIHALGLAAGEGADDRLVVIGGNASGMRVASYGVHENVPEENAEFFEPIPQSGGSSCVDSKGPFSLVTGNFDADNGQSANDVAFSDGNQAWSYLVGTWDFPTSWDVSCIGGNVMGSFPDQLLNSARRLGVVAVPREAPLLDEFLDVGASFVAWPTKGISFGFTISDAQGLGVGRVRLGDQHNDFLIWNHGSPNSDIASFALASAGDGTERTLAVTISDVDVEGERPQGATLIEFAGQDYVAIVAGSKLRYFSAGSGFNPQIIPLNFEPVALLTVNWGPSGADQILLFDGRTGAYACFEATAPGVLSTCADLGA
jgi:hypothetical protein